MAYELNQAQRNWIAALRSGDYKQAIGLLHDHETGCMCCLGVACNIHSGLEPEPGTGHYSHRVFYGGDSVAAPAPLVEALKLRDELGWIDVDQLSSETRGWLGGQSNLAGLNDVGVPFTEIADFIEANPEAVFTA